MRHKSILVQNNGPKAVTVTMMADPWTDCSGRTSTSTTTGTTTGANAAPTITFTPPTLTLEPCEAKETVAQISVKAPLEAGNTYFTRIHMQGTNAKPILVELGVEAENRMDYCAQTDPCRRRHDEYVDVCCDPCHHHHSCCHHDSCCDDPCGHHHHHHHHPKRWCDPFDPFRFHGLGDWERFWVASGKPCC